MFRVASLIALGLFWVGAVVPAAAGLQRFQAPMPGGEMPPLVIYSTLDMSLAEPLVEGFQRDNPGLAVDYHELDSLEIYERILGESRPGERTADLVLSSAMDLQIKLVNDGYSRPFDTSLEAPAMPEWANWRNEVFGFTFEPAVIIYNKAALPADLVPTSHAHLAELLKSHPGTLFGKVATYDPQRSGLGFLFVTQDEKAWPGFWSLVQGFGGVGVKLYSTSRPMIERVASGKFLIAYNILGSYALSLQRQYPDLGIVIPRDYALVMSRIAILPRQSPSPRSGERFLDFLLSREGQSIIADKASLYSLHPAVSGVATAQWLRKTAGKSLRPIRVSPELLVYLDQVKRQKFLKRWEKALGGR